MKLLFLFLRMAAAVFLVYILYKVMLKGERLNLFQNFRRRSQKNRVPEEHGKLEEMQKDPICGTYLPESQAVTLLYKREIFFFCSEECKNKFLELNE